MHGLKEDIILFQALIHKSNMMRMQHKLLKKQNDDFTWLCLRKRLLSFLRCCLKWLLRLFSFKWLFSFLRCCFKWLLRLLSFKWLLFLLGCCFTKDSNRQDRFILWVSKITTDYDRSWWRPTWILLASVLGLAFWATSLIDDPCQWDWEIFGKIFLALCYPLTNLSSPKVLFQVAGKELEFNNISFWLHLINFVHKVCVYFFLYEIIKVFRRFGK